VLKAAGAVAISREIVEARKHRREAIESWGKILSPILPWLITLAATLVSLILASRLP